MLLYSALNLHFLIDLQRFAKRKKWKRSSWNRKKGSVFFFSNYVVLVVDPHYQKRLEMLLPICPFDHFIVFQGMSHSRPDTEGISLCYANRSAALFHLGQYEVSIELPGVLPVSSVEDEGLSVSSDSCHFPQVTMNNSVSWLEKAMALSIGIDWIQ